MADGCRLVDAAEGVPQNILLRLALNKVAPIVVINKVDRKDQRTTEVEHEIADLFWSWLWKTHNWISDSFAKNKGISAATLRNNRTTPCISPIR